MRLVGGRLKGRRLAAGVGPGIRPTADRVRESLFNILVHAEWAPPLDGAVVLDAFCGTGALGLEALSRGAAHVLFVDQNRASLALVHRNLRDLGEEAAATLIRADATRPPAAPRRAGLAFLDPPYAASDGATSLAGAAIAAFKAAGWFGPEALVTVEERDGIDPALPSGCTRLDRRTYGETALHFIRVD